MTDENAKVIGHQTDEDGETYGVWGEVDSAEGYGLYTPDDARVEGLLSTRGSFEVETSSDRALELGTVTRQAPRDSPLEFVANGNVIFGYLNEVDDAIGATISGGGSDDIENSEERPNLVSGDFGTVSGGEGNEAVTDDSTVGGGQDNVAGSAGNEDATHATVSGGEANSAIGEKSTVGGGLFNAANNTYATIGGGRANTAMAESSTIGGGEQNIARFSDDTVGGGNDNEAGGGGATVGGGRENEADGLVSTVGGGEDNSAGGNGGTVGGGTNNEAIGGGATVSGGSGNVASGSRAAVGGGLNNEASGNYSFAAGSEAKAQHNGAFVVGDSSSSEVTSQKPDEARFQGDLATEGDIETEGELSFADGSPQRTGGPVAKGRIYQSGGQLQIADGSVNIVGASFNSADGVCTVETTFDIDTHDHVTTVTTQNTSIGWGSTATHVSYAGSDGEPAQQVSVYFEDGDFHSFGIVIHSLA